MKNFFIGSIIILAVGALALNIIPSSTDRNSNNSSLNGNKSENNSVGLMNTGKGADVSAFTAATSTIPEPAATKKKSVVETKISATKATTAKTSVSRANDITTVKTSSASKTAAPTVSSGSGTVKWATSGLNAIGSLASFDYSTSIRNAYKRKVEAYAKSKGITLITAAVVNSMRQ